MEELVTLILPAGEQGTEILVMTDIIVKGDDAYPLFRDITYCQPCYVARRELEYIFGQHIGMIYNIWTYEDIEEAIDHMD